MARNESGWRQLGSTIVTGVCASVGVVVLVTTPAWSTLTRVLGIGDGSASLEDLTSGSSEQLTRNPDAKTPAEWWALIAGDAATDTTTDEADTATADTGADEENATTDDATDVTLTAADALTLLDDVTVANPVDDTDYDRASMFGGWASTGDGEATTRDTVLARDLEDVTYDEENRVVSGTLTDPYTWEEITYSYGVSSSGDVWVDHIVSLEDAYRSGAIEWSEEERVAFANDPDTLIAVSGEQAESKGDGFTDDGSLWLPDDATAACGYAAARVAVKHSYDLSMSYDEWKQTREELESCAAE